MFPLYLKAILVLNTVPFVTTSEVYVLDRMFSVVFSFFGLHVKPFDFFLVSAFHSNRHRFSLSVNNYAD